MPRPSTSTFPKQLPNPSLFRSKPEISPFPTLPAGELCFKNQLLGEPLFISHQREKHLKCWIDLVHFPFGQNKGWEGPCWQREHQKHSPGTTQTSCHTIKSILGPAGIHKIHPWPSRNGTPHKPHGSEGLKAKLVWKMQTFDLLPMANKVSHRK